jgi:hypothetical protein
MAINRINAALTGIAWMLSISGCSSLGDLAPSSKQTITIHSDPAQATVLADGTEIGITPLTFNPADAFRTGFTGGDNELLAYRYVGKLKVKKSGCTDYVTEVDDNILSKDIDVKLECDPDYRPPSAPAATVPSAPTVTAPATPGVAAPDALSSMPASAEERLQRIDALHKKGLINSDEYQELRQRVLDTL